MDHAAQMDRFRDFLTEKGLKFTSQREVIARVFFGSAGHLSLDQLLDHAKVEQDSIGYATVYRTMKLLAESGLASEHDFGKGGARFEPTIEGEHHDHLLCVRCHRIVEFEDHEIERLQHAVAASHGYEITSHRHEIYGVCEPCRASA